MNRDGAKRLRVLPPLYKASIKSLAKTSQSPAEFPRFSLDHEVTERIRKCLTRGGHATTPEKEAKAALFLASKLMARYNITTADVIASDPNKYQYGGQSDVWIYYFDETEVNARGDPKKVPDQSFVSTLVNAITTFFDCKSYCTRGNPCMKWTFYGIAENTVSAARSFESVYNLVADWARFQKGVSAKHSYCEGIADGLYAMAEEVKRHEERKSKEAEIGNSDDTDDNNLFYGVNESGGGMGDSGAGRVDFNEEAHTKAELNPDVDEEIANIVKTTWSSHMQLQVFRESSAQVADAYLKAQGVDLSSAGRSRTSIKDQVAYKEGKRDAKNVDAFQKKIMDSDQT